MHDDLTIDLEAIKNAAADATPGMWHSPGLAELHDEAHRTIGTFSDTDPVPYEERPVPNTDEGDRNAKYVAAVCPPVVLKLISRLETAESLLETFGIVPE